MMNQMNKMNHKNHLTIDEMIEFVSFNKIDEKSIALSSKVNAHLLICDECAEKVSSFQDIYDELLKIGKMSEIKALMKEKKTNHIER